MIIRCVIFADRTSNQTQFINYRFSEFYSSISYCETWLPGRLDYFSINITTYHLRREGGLDYEDQLRWVRESTYSVEES